MTTCGVLPRLYDALSPGCGTEVSGGEGAGGSGVKLPSSVVVVWLPDPASEPDEPPQATRSVDNKQIQTMAIDACVDRFDTKAEALERLQNFEERYFILEHTVNIVK